MGASPFFVTTILILTIWRILVRKTNRPVLCNFECNHQYPACPQVCEMKISSSFEREHSKFQNSH